MGCGVRLAQITAEDYSIRLKLPSSSNRLGKPPMVTYPPNDSRSSISHAAPQTCIKVSTLVSVPVVAVAQERKLFNTYLYLQPNSST